MSGFSGREPTFLYTTIANDGFYPDLSLGEFQKLHRIPSHYADEAIAHQVDLARGELNHQLAAQKILWTADSHTTLAEVDLADSGNRARDYKAAIFYRAKALLLIDFQTMSRRESAEDQAKEADATNQRLLAESRKAVRRLLGHATTIDVELL